MKKCDIIIPIYNSPDWVKLCVYALFENTPKEYINKVILMNDNSNDFTSNSLKNLKKKYGKYITLVNNKENLGFVKNVNKGLEKCSADYVLLLNTDCLLSRNTIPKLINHIEKNNKIGLICPVSSNAANLSLEMFEGFNYNQMNDLLESKFSGMTFDACTVVGNCLMITKECINKTGFLDEAYGMGYGEETDYQFAAISKGFEAKVAIDTYVFHKSEVSFGQSQAKTKRLEKNRELFFSRWGDEYEKLMSKYSKNDPIKYINNKLTKNDKKAKCDLVFYLTDIVQTAGGVHAVVDMVNYLSIKGISANITYNNLSDYKEIIIFNPIKISNIRKVEIKKMVSTIFVSTFLASKIASELKIPLIYFVQGYEFYFENASIYGTVELTYKLADKVLTISDYLANKQKEIFGINAKVIPNGINYDLIHKKNLSKKPKTITFILRNNIMKGDFLLLDIIKAITVGFIDLELNIIYMDKNIKFPQNDNEKIKINYILGPLSRNEVIELLQKSDIYFDASIAEGFGLTPLEAMAAGAIPIVSNSLGNDQYMLDGYNGYVIDKVNDIDVYMKKLEKIINDNELYQKLKDGCLETCKKFDYDDTVSSYVKFFTSTEIEKKKKIDFTPADIGILKEIEFNKPSYINRAKNRAKSKKKIKKFLRFVAKITPKSLKRNFRRLITLINEMND